MYGLLCFCIKLFYAFSPPPLDVYALTCCLCVHITSVTCLHHHRWVEIDKKYYVFILVLLAAQSHVQMRDKQLASFCVWIKQGLVLQSWTRPDAQVSTVPCNAPPFDSPWPNWASSWATKKIYSTVDERSRVWIPCMGQSLSSCPSHTTHNIHNLSMHFFHLISKFESTLSIESNV